MYTGWKKAAVIGLSAGLVLAGLSGCSREEFNAEAAAVTVNDDTISAGLLRFATRYAQAQYESLYQAYGMTNAFNQDLYGNGVTLGESLVESMASQLTDAVLAEQKMDEYGVSLTEEDEASITEAASAFLEDNDQEVLDLIGADQATVERYLELVVIQDKMEEAMSADVDTEVSDEEAAQRRIQYTLFTPVTEEETEGESETEGDSEAASEAASEADTEAASEGAQETEASEETEAASEAETEAASETETEVSTEAQTASLEENEDAAATQSAEEDETEAASEAVTEEAAEDASEEDTEAVTEEAAETEEETETETETETEDPETAAAKAKAYDKAVELIERIQEGEDFETASQEVDPDATCSTMTFGESNGGQEELLDATDGLADGTLVEEPVETDSGYYVVYLETQLDREATDSEKDRIVEQRRQDQISELYTEWQEESDIETDSGVLADITFDFSLEQYVETEAVTEAGTEGASEAGTESASEENAETETDTEAVTEEAAEAETDTEAVSEEAAESEGAAESETEEEAAGSQEASEADTETEE